MDYTTNYNLNKPTDNEKYTKDHQNSNMDIIDAKLKEHEDAISEQNVNLTSHKTSGDHDGRYYTESEVNTKLAGKSDTSHSHSWSAITGKPTSFTPSSHTHDDRYYTETEINAKIIKYATVTLQTDAYAEATLNAPSNSHIINVVSPNALVVVQGVTNKVRVFGELSLQALNPLINKKIDCTYYYITY